MKKNGNAIPSANAAKPAVSPRRKPAQAGKAPRQDAPQQVTNNTAVAAAQQAKLAKSGSAPAKSTAKPVAKPAAKAVPAQPAKQAAAKPNGQANRAAKVPAAAIAAPKPSPVNGDSKPAQASTPPAAAAKPINGDSKPAEARGEKKAKKAKVVRDSFTMPENDYGKIAALKKQCLAAGLPVKKSELLRAGLNALSELPMAELAALIGRLENVKTGRPSKR
jgi:hypothetical protein